MWSDPLHCGNDNVEGYIIFYLLVVYFVVLIFIAGNNTDKFVTPGDFHVCANAQTKKFNSFKIDCSNVCGIIQ